jgi:hypothetical protein
VGRQAILDGIEHRQRHAARAEFASKDPGTSEWVTLTRLQGMMPLYGLLNAGSGWWVP